MQDARDKLAVARAIVAERGLTLDQVAFMGDDVLDVALLGAVGLGVAPANARPEAKEAADWITEASGGAGAVRELTDLLLRYRA